MVKQDQVQSGLRRVGMFNRYWGRAEMRELANILMPDEAIIGAVNGKYESGFAMLVATDRRLLLIDKKIMFVNLEDIHYDNIAQVEFSAGPLDAAIVVHTLNTVVHFVSWRKNNLRQLTSFVQERVMELRHMRELNEHLQTEQVTSTSPVISHYVHAVPDVQNSPTVPSDSFAQRVSRSYNSTPLSVRQRLSRFYLSDD